MKTRLIVTTILLVVAAVIIAGTNLLRGQIAEPTSGTKPAAAPSRSVAPPKPATVSDVTDPQHRPVFGVSVADRKPTTLAGIAQTAGCAPRWVQIFASVPDGISTEALSRSGPGITPMLTIEPWHSGLGASKQADFTLAATIAGKWDAQYKKMAAAVRAYSKPVMIRYAHEMNGDWYPWGLVGSNTPAGYIQAWRHVVTLFRQAGAVNALWVWAPNIRRGADQRDVGTWWPGDAYVDLVGLTGYGVDEESPEDTYAGTLPELAELTSKPVVLTETGAKPGTEKTAWIAAFGQWLADHPSIIGFLWTERSGYDATADWRYDDTDKHLAAFRQTLITGGVAC